MIKEIINLDNAVIAIEDKSNKTLAILGDLLETYGFAGERPTKEERDKLSCEAIKIVRYISIALDYTYDTKKELDKAHVYLEDMSAELRNHEATGGNN